MFTDDDMKQFRQRLAETIAWCAERGSASDPTGSLRTELLRPADLIEIEGEYAEVIAERRAILRALAGKRAGFLRASGRYPSAPAQDIADGRLLLFNPEDTLADGAAEVASNGFFDLDNVPPWDTWVCYVVEDAERYRSYLISWAPPQLVAMADAGIDVNPEGCILWAADLDAAFTRRLRQAGIVL
jgi:hypothetical protein